MVHGDWSARGHSELKIVVVANNNIIVPILQAIIQLEGSGQWCSLMISGMSEQGGRGG